MAALHLSAPKAWTELTQEQLAALLDTMVNVNARNADRRFVSADDFAAQSAAQVAVRCLFVWNNVKVVTPYADGWLVDVDGRECVVSAPDVAAAADMLRWVAELPDGPVRLDLIAGAKAVDAELDDSFSFDDWLTCETLWQAYQSTQDAELLRRMAEVLYRKQGISLSPAETLSVFYWWAGLKALCNRLYPHFFHPADGAGGNSQDTDRDMLRRNIDAQIRALTKGDITKEERVLAMPAHRALTELDALAREYDELNRKYPAK